MNERLLREKLRKIEALFAGAATSGEKQAAGEARARIRAKLNIAKQKEHPTETRFSIQDPWSRKLFLALCRRYGLNPYRYPRMKRQSIIISAPKSFVDKVLWPEFQATNAALTEYLLDITQKLIKEEVYGETIEEAEVKPESTTKLSLPKF